jgi:hypothetical protein
MVLNTAHFSLTQHTTLNTVQCHFVPTPTVHLSTVYTLFPLHTQHITSPSQKVKLSLCTPLNTIEELEAQLHTFLPSAPDDGSAQLYAPTALFSAAR